MFVEVLSQVHIDGSVQPLYSTTSTLSQSSHGCSGRTPDGRRPIPRIVRKALAALPYFFCNELPLASRLNKCCKLLVRRRSQQLKPITLTLDLHAKLPEHFGSNRSSCCEEPGAHTPQLQRRSLCPAASTVSSRFVQQWLSRTADPMKVMSSCSPIRVTHGLIGKSVLQPIHTWLV